MDDALNKGTLKLSFTPKGRTSIKEATKALVR